jgi:predicted HAD superfamily phosphohydrolase YqeG
MKVKRDANHAELTRYYEQMGASVKDTAMVGDGWTDVVIGYRGIDSQAEFKTVNGILEQSQVDHHRDWRGRRPRVVRNLNDVIDHIRQLDADANRAARK